jgi:hypothetical protein
MLLQLGLRRGEPAILSADVIKDDFDPETGGVKYWLNVDEPNDKADQRYAAPGLKTSYSRRQIPVSQEILNSPPAF